MFRKNKGYGSIVMLLENMCRNASCMWFVVNGLKHAETRLWSFTDGDRRSSFSDNTEGDKHLSHRQMLFVCCDVHVTALWWRREASQAQPSCFVSAHHTDCCCPLLFMHVQWHGTSPFPPPSCVTSPMKHLLPLSPFLCNVAHIIRTLSCFLPLPSRWSPSP